MLQQKSVSSSRSRKTVSLSVRISLLLILAAILPLLVAVTSSEMLTRPQLVTQAATEMESDARTKVSLIDAYLIERIQDVETFSKSSVVQNYLAGDTTTTQAVRDTISSELQLDANYDTWTLLDPQQGKPLLSYPDLPQIHGNNYIPIDYLAQLQHTNRTLLSNVFYNTTRNQAYIDIYTPVFQSHLLGIVRATLGIYYIWNLVNNEATDRNDGSYASIIDDNGVRVAYTIPQTNTTYNYSANNPTGNSLPPQLFTAIGPLSSRAQQQIKTQDLYNNDSKKVNVVPDTTLAQALHQNTPPATLSLIPNGQTMQFEAALYRSSVMPWTYVVFSPLSVITAIANQQLLYASLIALFVLILAALIGLGFGRRIAGPIITSVASLSASSQSLKTLATKEQTTATEQRWMIESSQVGLQSIQYYTNATNVAAHRLTDFSAQLLERWRYLDEGTIVKYLTEMHKTAKYIENAAGRQEESSNNMAAAIRVTSQVTEQLSTGADAAAEASEELESVVSQLRTVVGESIRRR